MCGNSIHSVDTLWFKHHFKYTLQKKTWSKIYQWKKQPSIYFVRREWLNTVASYQLDKYIRHLLDAVLLLLLLLLPLWQLFLSLVCFSLIFSARENRKPIQMMYSLRWHIHMCFFWLLFNCACLIKCILMFLFRFLLLVIALCVLLCHVISIPSSRFLFTFISCSDSQLQRQNVMFSPFVFVFVSVVVVAVAAGWLTFVKFRWICFISHFLHIDF